MYWLVVLVFAWIVYRLHGPSSNEVPIFGVYRQEGFFYPFKLIFMYVILSTRKLLRYMKLEDFDYDSFEVQVIDAKAGGYGQKSRPTPTLMDCSQTLSVHPKAIDAVYFNGANKDGWYFIAAIARRPHGVVNGFLYVKIPGVGLLVLPKLPDTMLFQEEPSETYSAEGLEIKVFQAMIAWVIKYEGPMRFQSVETSEYAEGSIVNVKINSLFSSERVPFDFDTDMSPLAVAKCMAKELWSKDYFKLLKEYHQTHYEQFGELTGTIEIQDKTNIPFVIDTVRDHSYGEKRDWKNLHRYALHFISLEDGTRIAVHVISLPVIFSNIEMGYVYTPENELHPVENTTFRLYEHGECGTPPKDYAFSFTAGHKTYHVKVQVLEIHELYIGFEWEARVLEAFSKFEVNGIPGWGSVEFEYRNLRGRPLSQSQKDPKWVQDIVKN